MASAGPIDGRCGAKTSGGGYCSKRPMTGQRRCGTHGGRAPQAIAAAERRQQEAAALQAVRTFGLRRDVTAEDALLEELQWTAGHVAWLRDRVAELSPEALVWGRTSEVAKEATEFPGVDTTSEAQPNIWLTLYQRERAHLLAVGTAVVKAGVEERRVRIAERQGVLVAGVLRGALTDLGHDLGDPRVLQVVSTRLRALAGAEAAA